jgi:hypothetical protein
MGKAQNVSRFSMHFKKGVGGGRGGSVERFGGSVINEAG